MDGITWEKYLDDIKVIFEISQRLNDNWVLTKKNDAVGGTYLVKRIGVSVPIGEINAEEFNGFEEESNLAYEEKSSGKTPTNEPIQFEYHVLYHISYAVPYLCFNAYRSNGSLLTLDDAWKIFNDIDVDLAKKSQLNMYEILTQMEHPVLFKPFLTFHPCRIAEVLHSLPNSKNKVLSFLSTYGPTMYLTFDLKYATFVNDENKDEK